MASPAPKTDASFVQLFADALGFLHSQLGTVFTVHTPQLNQSYAFLRQHTELPVQFGACLIREGRQHKSCHEILLPGAAQRGCRIGAVLMIHDFPTYCNQPRPMGQKNFRSRGIAVDFLF